METIRGCFNIVAKAVADERDQVQWAGFDELEFEGGVPRQVLLLGYRSGFEVWDIQDPDDARKLASSCDGSVTFLQVLRKPIVSKRSPDKFADYRPLLVVVGGASTTNGFSNCDDGLSCVDTTSNSHRQEKEIEMSMSDNTTVHFYSLKTHVNVHTLSYRSPVYSVRCSTGIVAIMQETQIHCFDAATLGNKYTFFTYPVPASLDYKCIGYGPLAVGSRWLAYSGSPVAVSSTDCVSPQHLSSSASPLSPLSDGSLITHYAKESSKQLISGIATLGDKGYKKLSKYWSDINSSVSSRQSSPSFKSNGTSFESSFDMGHEGLVIVRDFVSRSVVVQFRAHKSHIAALCFDTSGTLLATASIHGNNINIYHVTPSSSTVTSGSVTIGSCLHLYRLQRGFTNAVIQDISFSDDAKYIMISSSKGTTHLFELPPSGGVMSHPDDFNLTKSTTKFPMPSKTFWPPSGSDLPQLERGNLSATGVPVTLSVVSRIRNDCTWWTGSASGAAAAVATGMIRPFRTPIACAFYNCRGAGHYPDSESLHTKYRPLVFSPSGCMTQYEFQPANEGKSESDPHDLQFQHSNSGLVVEAVQKWDICHKKSRRDHEDGVDTYGEFSTSDNTALLTKKSSKGTIQFSSDCDTVTQTCATEEKHYSYILEAEFRTRPFQVPLWENPHMHFQQITVDFQRVSFSTYDGEIGIETLPTRTVETRSKDLIPVFDNPRTPRLQLQRASTIDRHLNEPSQTKKNHPLRL